jgi:hypothetical protein
MRAPLKGYIRLTLSMNGRSGSRAVGQCGGDSGEMRAGAGLLSPLSCFKDGAETYNQDVPNNKVGG